MSEMELENILQIAKQLVGRLPVEMDEELRRLITCAEEEQDPDIGLDILSLLTRHENVRRWLNEQSQSQDGQEIFKGEAGSRSRGEYTPLAGSRTPVPASRKWICPKGDCRQSLPVIQEDEDPPRCRVHRCIMIRDGR